MVRYGHRDIGLSGRLGNSSGKSKRQCERATHKSIHLWVKIGIEIFTFNNYDYCIKVNYRSGLFEINRQPIKVVPDIVYCMKQQFSRNGIPDTVIYNNLTFNLREFKAFATKYEFQHIVLSLRYAQNNSHVENAVKTAKRLMTKVHEDKRDSYLYPLECRNRPSEKTGTSLVQILFGRCTQSLLPVVDELLRPELTLSRTRCSASYSFQNHLGVLL